jgi:hypothetical protein
VGTTLRLPDAQVAGMWGSLYEGEAVIWMTTNLTDAKDFARGNAGDPSGFVYRVEPQGEVFADMDYDGERWVTTSPVTVVEMVASPTFRSEIVDGRPAEEWWDTQTSQWYRDRFPDVRPKFAFSGTVWMTKSTGTFHRSINCRHINGEIVTPYPVDDLREPGMVEVHGARACTTCFPSAPSRAASLPAWLRT